MSVPRTLVWTPVPTAELQLALHTAGAGPAVLVPVASGTVLLPPQGARYSVAVRLAEQCQEVASRVLLLRWNDLGAVGRSFPCVTSRSWYLGSSTAARRLAGWFKISRRESATARLAAVFERPADRIGGDGLVALLRSAGRPDLARVVQLVGEGRADTWVAALPAPGHHPINTVLPVIPVTQGAAPTDPPLT